MRTSQRALQTINDPPQPPDLLLQLPRLAKLEQLIQLIVLFLQQSRTLRERSDDRRACSAMVLIRIRVADVR